MVATEMVDNGCKRLSQVHESDPELRRIVSDWPKLSKTAKRMIVAVLLRFRSSLTFPFALRMLVETPDFQGFLLLPRFDNALLWIGYRTLVGG